MSRLGLRDAIRSLRLAATRAANELPAFVVACAPEQREEVAANLRTEIRLKRATADLLEALAMQPGPVPQEALALASVVNARAHQQEQQP